MDSNHPSYGRIRRLHLILMYLFGDNLPHMEQAYQLAYNEEWFVHVTNAHSTYSFERTVAQMIIQRFFNL